MVLAAAGGLLAGCLPGCGSEEPAPHAVAESGESAKNVLGDSTPRLLQDPHVCRGINTCENKGKSGSKNHCAGQANCATVASHDCNGLNDCKGQGGCGDYPGENSCKGQGGCSVPLSDKAWPIARRRFEELMREERKTFGEAPDKKG
jgi:hypothetical protein